MGKHYVSYNLVNRPDGKFEMWVSTPCWSEAEAFGVGSYMENRKASEAYVPEPEPITLPPPCDGDARYGQETTQSGQVLAQAQHEAATDGDDCTAGACLLTRGSD